MKDRKEEARSLVLESKGCIYTCTTIVFLLSLFPQSFFFLFFPFFFFSISLPFPLLHLLRLPSAPLVLSKRRGPYVTNTAQKKAKETLLPFPESFKSRSPLGLHPFFFPSSLGLPLEIAGVLIFLRIRYACCSGLTRSSFSRSKIEGPHDRDG